MTPWCYKCARFSVGGFCICGPALAAATGTAKTAKPVECEASQSGDAKQRNARPLSDRIEQLNQGGSK